MHNEKIDESSALSQRKMADIVSKEEIKLLTKRSDVFGFWAIGFTWSVIMLTVAVMAWSLSLSTWQMLPIVILGINIVGGSQLALSILTHEGSHGTLFKHKWLNEKLTD